MRWNLRVGSVSLGACACMSPGYTDAQMGCVQVVTTIDDHPHYRIIARHLGMDVEGSEIEAEMDGDAAVSAAECGNDIDGQRMSEDAGVMVMGGADDVATYVD